jgi:arsenate reductase (thioredoxin)
VSETRKRVLFLCIGNACRSQMAEGFARAYGSDTIIPASAGLAPGARLAADTVRAMAEKNIDIRDHYPKAIHHLGRAEFDLVVNMSGWAPPDDLLARTQLREWDVDDPVLVKYEKHCEVRDQIERLVMGLIEELRKEREGLQAGRGSV